MSKKHLFVLLFMFVGCGGNGSDEMIPFQNVGGTSVEVVLEGAGGGAEVVGSAGSGGEVVGGAGGGVEFVGGVGGVVEVVGGAGGGVEVVGSAGAGGIEAAGGAGGVGGVVEKPKHFIAGKLDLEPSSQVEGFLIAPEDFKPTFLTLLASDGSPLDAFMIVRSVSVNGTELANNSYLVRTALKPIQITAGQNIRFSVLNPMLNKISVLVVISGLVSQ